MYWTQSSSNDHIRTKFSDDVWPLLLLLLLLLMSGHNKPLISLPLPTNRYYDTPKNNNTNRSIKISPPSQLRSPLPPPRYHDMETVLAELWPIISTLRPKVKVVVNGQVSSVHTDDKIWCQRQEGRKRALRASPPARNSACLTFQSGRCFAFCQEICRSHFLDSNDKCESM